LYKICWTFDVRHKEFCVLENTDKIKQAKNQFILSKLEIHQVSTYPKPVLIKMHKIIAAPTKENPTLKTVSRPAKK